MALLNSLSRGQFKWERCGVYLTDSGAALHKLKLKFSCLRSAFLKTVTCNFWHCMWLSATGQPTTTCGVQTLSSFLFSSRRAPSEVPTFICSKRAEESAQRSRVLSRATDLRPRRLCSLATQWDKNLFRTCSTFIMSAEGGHRVTCSWEWAGWIGLGSRTSARAHARYFWRQSQRVRVGSGSTRRRGAGGGAERRFTDAVKEDMKSVRQKVGLNGGRQLAVVTPERNDPEGKGRVSQ